jgi:hypothetical protein
MVVELNRGGTVHIFSHFHQLPVQLVTTGTLNKQQGEYQQRKEDELALHNVKS